MKRFIRVYGSVRHPVFLSRGNLLLTNYSLCQDFKKTVLLQDSILFSLFLPNGIINFVVWLIPAVIFDQKQKNVQKVYQS